MINVSDAFGAQKRCPDGIINEPGTRSSRRELLNFPSRPAFSTVTSLFRNTKKANPNLLVLIGNSCQTVPTRLVLGSRLPLAVLRNAFSSQTSTRVVSTFPNFYRIIRSLPDRGSYAEIDLMTTSRSPLVSLCDAPLFLRERRNRFSAPARSNRPQAEYDRHRLHIGENKRHVISDYQSFIRVFTFTR